MQIPVDIHARLDDADAEPTVAFDRPMAQAAVLVPLLHAPAPELLLIERSRSLRHHAGQLAFPGGKREVSDASLLATALRESEEEVGLAVGEVEVLGRLSPTATPSGFVIHPFVGRVQPRWQPQPPAGEVAQVLRVPLTRLADPALHRVTGRGVWNGYRYEMHEFAIHDPPLWGATARITWELLQRLRS